LDEQESKQQELSDKLVEIEKTTDENDQAKKILENRSKSDENKLHRLETELADYNKKNGELNVQLEEACNIGKRISFLIKKCISYHQPFIYYINPNISPRIKDFQNF